MNVPNDRQHGSLIVPTERITSPPGSPRPTTASAQATYDSVNQRIKNIKDGNIERYQPKENKS